MNDNEKYRNRRSWWIPVMNGSLPGQGFETDELQRRKVEQIWQQLRQRKH